MYVVIFQMTCWIPFARSEEVAGSLRLSNLGGVCYDPNHHSFSAEESQNIDLMRQKIAQDMQQIKSSGFRYVRTYTAMYGAISLAPLIAAAGLSAAIGIPMKEENPKTLRANIDAAIDGAENGYVHYIFVGNENILKDSPQRRSSISKTIQTIAQVKAQLRTRHPDVQVGTVQRTTEILELDASDWTQLLNTCDILGANIHPFFSTPAIEAVRGIEALQNQWRAIQDKLQRHSTKVLLTEVGWPSQGNWQGNAGSEAGARVFFEQYQTWIDDHVRPQDRYYFQMYDQRYKVEDQNQPEYEGAFGLLDREGQSKGILPLSSSLNGRRDGNTEKDGTNTALALVFVVIGLVGLTFIGIVLHRRYRTRGDVRPKIDLGQSTIFQSPVFTPVLR